MSKCAAAGKTCRRVLVFVSDVRVATNFLIRAGSRDRAVARGTHVPRITPKRAGSERSRLRLPRRAPLREFRVGKFHVHGSLLGVDHDDVALAEETNGSAFGGFRPDMANAESAR